VTAALARRLLVGALVLAFGAGLSRVADAQVQVGVEVLRDRVTYRFENPSSFDTPDLVPHFFEQHYVRDNAWVTGALAYRAGVDWQTDAGLTVVRRGTATDYDTFFDPGGVTWVSGTSGDARMHAFRVSQRLRLGRAGAVQWWGGYRARIDFADFLEGDKTDARNGTVVRRSVVTTREYTNAQRHEVFIAGTHERALSGRWTLLLDGDAAPAAIDRLAIRLPDKYPGRTLVYRTTTLATTAALTLRRSGAWPVDISVRGGRSWNYRSTDQARRSEIGLAVTVHAR
jgi:hypothetical protein